MIKTDGEKHHEENFQTDKGKVGKVKKREQDREGTHRKEEKK